MAWRGADHPPSSSAEVKERVELYLYSPSGPSWPVLGKSLPLPLPLQCPSSEKQISTLPTRLKFWCPLLFTKMYSVPTYSFCRHSYTGHTQKNGAVFIQYTLKPHHSFVYALYKASYLFRLFAAIISSRDDSKNSLPLLTILLVKFKNYLVVNKY